MSLQSDETRQLEIFDRGAPEDFPITNELQKQLAAARQDDPSLPDALVLVEHNPIYTTGRGAPLELSKQSFAASVPVVEINRGGRGTFHGPGQLVIYPIFSLERHGKDVHVFLRRLEEVIIKTLEKYGLAAFPRVGLTGVWIPDESGTPKKVASIGIGVSRWVSYHGLALNVSTDLSYFREISPCGQDGEVMTNLQDVCRARDIHIPDVAEVKKDIIEAFVEVFGFHSGEKAELKPARIPKPSWIKVKAPGSPEYLETRQIVKQLKLHTVCEEAHCPNIGECWSHHTATFMIMGALCTRRCSFCAVQDGTLESLEPLDILEPFRTAQAIQKLGLKHVVITSVDRDDLKDMGAEHFNKTVRFISQLNPATKIELLIPDMRGKRDFVRTILQSGFVSVLNHNVETVPRLYRRVRPGSNFKRSVDVLRWARELWPNIKTKSGLMLGLGETKDEVLEVMDQLREADVNILTLGQYLRPSDKQLPVDRFVTPEEFAEYKVEGDHRGFSFVESGPLVRSSYHAWKHSAEPESPPSEAVV